jgi:tetratricopeptide (TPR) repeat protein
VQFQSLEGEVRGRLPAGIGGKVARSRFWGEECYRYLSRCDYHRAYLAAQWSLQAHSQSLEGALGLGVAAAYFGQGETTERVLGWAIQTYGLGRSVSWALGWALTMLGDWSGGETYLLDTVARRPGEVALRSMLGYCQWQQGKLRKAVASVREAIALEPDEPRHHVLLMRVLLSAGRVKEALRELQAVERPLPDDEQVLLGGVSAHLLLGNRAEAERRAARLRERHPGAQTLLQLAQAYDEAKLEEPARGCLEEVCAHGFYPEAHLGLARIAYLRKEYDPARAHLLASLDLTRERPPEASHPLSLLESVARGLAAMREPVEGCSAWWASVDMSGSPAEVKRLSFLVIAPNAAEARDQIRALYQAMHPGRDLAPQQIAWQPSPDHKPDGPCAPGIYGHRFE